MGRKPIGHAAMTNAERQKRFRERHKATPSERFRRQIYWLIRWFSNWLSGKEIQETLHDFGIAWRQDVWYANGGKEELPPRTRLDGEREPWMDRVNGGEHIMGNPGDVLGDEERYRQEEETRLRKRAEWEAERRTRVWHG